MLTQEYLKSILKYYPKAGVFTWLKSTNGRIVVGDSAGTLSDGYVKISIKTETRKKYFAHRLAWLYMTGEWPKDQVDHINRMRNDNRWRNLRECNNTQNQINVGLSKNNKSGHKGVSWCKRERKWISRLVVNGVRKYLGSFDSKSDAAKTYNEKAKEVYGDFGLLGMGTLRSYDKKQGTARHKI